jgi:hypothetical protein
MDSWTRTLTAWGIAVSLLIGAAVLAMSGGSHWYVLLLVAGAAVFGLAGLWVAIQDWRARPRLFIESPRIEMRGIEKRPFIQGESVAGTIPAPQFYAASATSGGSAIASSGSASYEPLFFAYVDVLNRPRKSSGGKDAEKVHAKVRFFTHGGDLIEQINGKWSSSFQHPHSEGSLRAEEKDIPANENGEPLDIAMKYERDDQCHAFNEENRFHAPSDMRHRPLGTESSLIVEVELRGRNARKTRRFELSHGGVGSKPLFQELR